MNPLLGEAREYPFAKLLDIKRRREADGHRILDFGMGDPRDATPTFIREALASSVPEVSSYPTVRGKPELRQAIANYAHERFDVTLDPDRHILPVNGTKEGIFTAHLALVDPAGDRRHVIYFDPAYPVYREGARYAGGIPHSVSLTREHGFRPDLDALDPALLDQTAILWVNLPHNPTGAEGDPTLFERLRMLARKHGFVLASDECYADLYFAHPPPSALVRDDAPDFARTLSFHSCSKRSCMTGYRSGFVAGDPELIALLAKFRPSVGVATPSFVQDAATAAWSDAAHVRTIVEQYGRRRRFFLDLFERRGWSHDGGDATFYLWLRVPDGFGDSIRFAERLLEENILVTPGAYLGNGGEQHVRFALVATEDDCREAARRLEALTATPADAPGEIA